MAVNHYIDEARDLVVLRVRGRWRVADLLEALRRVMADPRFRFDQSVLVDCRRASLQGPTNSLRDVAQFVTSHVHLHHCAVLVDDDAGWGMARMFVALAGDDGGRFRPFREFPAACRWLGTPDLPDHARYARRRTDNAASAEPADAPVADSREAGSSG